MASKRTAKKAAARKSRQVYRANIRKPKRSVVKKFANFVGKTTYKVVSKMRKRRSRRGKRRYGRKRY